MTDENLAMSIGGIAIILSILGIWKLSEIFVAIYNMNFNFTFI